MEKAKVAVFIGSASDEATVAPCADILKKLGIPFRFTVTSAHRTPERTAELVDSLEAAGCEVFICAAGRPDPRASRSRACPSDPYFPRAVQVRRRRRRG